MKKILYLLGSIILALVILVASGIRFDVPVEKLKQKYANENSKFIMIDGLSVHYRDEGNGFPLILLHGAPSALQTWDVWAKELSNEFRIIRLDLPGYGLTGPNEDKDYSIEWYVKFMGEFLNELNIKNCYMAGNSFGGSIACEFAYQNKDIVKKLILIDSGGYPFEGEDIVAVKMARNPLLRPIVRYVTPRFFVAMNIKQVFGEKDKVTDAIIDRYYEFMLRKGNRETFIAVCTNKSNDLYPHIKDINIPALILWGKRDTTIPVKFAEYFHRDIVNSKVITYDSVGHIPQEEAPEKTASDTRIFLNEMIVK